MFLFFYLSDLIESNFPETDLNFAIFLDTPSAACLDDYPGKPPEMVPVDITDDVVLAVAGRLSGGAGPGGNDSISLQHWLLWFRVASR